MLEAPSPLLPTGVQFAWDSTSLEYLKRCPRLYYYEMICGYKPEGENVHLRFGSEYHQALHDYEIGKAEGRDHEGATAYAIRKLAHRIRDWNPTEERDGKAGKYKNRDTLFRTVIWYLDDHRNDPTVTILLDNGKPALEVSFRFELDYGPLTSPSTPYVLCGHMDRLCYWDEPGSVFIMDRKTTTYALGEWYFKQFEVHNQMSLYTFAGKVVLNTPVKGVVIDAAQIQITDTKFGRSVTYRNEARIEEWLQDLEYWLRKGEEYAIANYWPQNDTACDKYGGCRFREICSKSPQIRNKFLQASFTKEEPWNPLRPR